MWMHSWEWPGAWYAVGHALWWSLMIIATVAFVYWFRRFARGVDRGTEPFRALEILAERYARGEITQEEFELRRRVLRG